MAACSRVFATARSRCARVEPANRQAYAIDFPDCSGRSLAAPNRRCRNGRNLINAYREQRYARGVGFCCICGQPVYRFGWHVDLWNRGTNRNAHWHAACAVAWDFWTAPSDYARVLKRLQQRRCAETGGRLWKTAEVDHRVPLFRVWREHRSAPWPSLLGFWGVPNLQVINRDAHAGKCAEEARFRRVMP